MTAPVVIAQSSFVYQSSSTLPAVFEYTGSAIKYDLLLLWIFQFTVDADMTAPAGYTRLEDSGGPWRLFMKVADGGEYSASLEMRIGRNIASAGVILRQAASGQIDGQSFGTQGEAPKRGAVQLADHGYILTLVAVSNQDSNDPGVPDGPPGFSTILDFAYSAAGEYWRFNLVVEEDDGGSYPAVSCGVTSYNRSESGSFAVSGLDAVIGLPVVEVAPRSIPVATFAGAGLRYDDPVSRTPSPEPPEPPPIQTPTPPWVPSIGPYRRAR